MRTFITGDTHRDFKRIKDFVLNNKTTKDDILIILGDAGINYALDEKDADLKKELSELNITLFMIHGNHEERPFNIKGYELINKYDGLVYIQKEYPNLIFAKDGENYQINNHHYFVIGGAYSVDKNIRIIFHYPWFKSEQPTPSMKEEILHRLDKLKYDVDIILSHTCPYKYLPRYLFLKEVEQSKIDSSLEYWLDDIESKLKYNHWYYGHFHGDKDITSKVTLLFNEIREIV